MGIIKEKNLLKKGSNRRNNSVSLIYFCSQQKTTWSLDTWRTQHFVLDERNLCSNDMHVVSRSHVISFFILENSKSRKKDINSTTNEKGLPSLRWTTVLCPFNRTTIASRSKLPFELYPNGTLLTLIKVYTYWELSDRP